LLPILYELTDEQVRTGRELDKAKKAFELLKIRVQQLPVLRHADRTKPFTIILHANPWAVGAVLAQTHDGKLWPVRFIGRTLQDAELRYHEAEKEILALLRVLSSCYTLVIGQPLVIYTRHSVLKWIMTSKSLTERLMKWATFLSPWTFEVHKVEQDLDGLAALFTAGISPREKIDELVAGLVPAKAIKSAPIVSLEMLEAEYDGYVISFDGAAKAKGEHPRPGSAGFVL
jgi:RNase H-like domain found in reverse transcriptase